ncbi:MAG: patatin-like phospholipase family protein [Bacillota bacterium]|nr:patatin-like phospholipase family protein [Bacillota bacterium]
MKRKKLGLALGSGAARGFAHLGVIEALEEEGIPIDFVSGCSIGSIIGALYCCGMGTGEILKLAEEVDFWEWIDISIPKNGFILGKKIEQLMKKYTEGRTFEELRKPFAIVATDLESGRQVIFKNGYLYKAIRASIAIPGIFVPVEEEGRTLADGGLIDPVPVDLVKSMGADVVIGVNLGSGISEKEINSIYDVIIRSIDIMQNEIIRLRGIEADILINPDLRGINPVTFNQARECYQIGKTAAREKIGQIRSIMSKEDRPDWLHNLGRRKRHDG